jgi:hypothetical protein
MATTLQLVWNGNSFMLGNMPFWVRPVAVALAFTQPQDPSDVLKWDAVSG